MYLRRYIGNLISKIVMPSQMPTPLLMRSLNLCLDRIKKTYIKPIAHLNVYQYPRDKNDISAETKVMIHAVGNGDFAEFFHHKMRELANKNATKNVVVVAMNFRNVSNSTGTVTSENDWIEDATLVIDHYRARGVPMNNILLNGHSLGGAILTMTAAKVYQRDLAALQRSNPNATQAQKNNCAPRLINNRSFSNLADELMISFLGRRTGLLSGILTGLAVWTFLPFSTSLLIASGMFASGFVYPQIAEFVLRPVLNGLLWLGFGRMDALSAYKSLPTEAKECIIAKDDAIIHERATIHYNLRAERKAQKRPYARNLHRHKMTH